MPFPTSFKVCGFMWTFFFIEHLYLSGAWEGLQLRMVTQYNPRDDEIGVFAQNMDTILG